MVKDEMVNAEQPPEEEQTPITVELLYADLQKKEKYLHEVQDEVHKTKVLLSRELRRYGGEFRGERPAESSTPLKKAVPTRHRVAYKLPISHRILLAFSAVFSAAALILSVVVPVAVEPMRLPAWIGVALIIFAGFSIAGVILLFIAAAGAAYFAFVKSAASGPQLVSVPFSEVETPKGGFSPFHDEPLDRGVPVYEQRAARRPEKVTGDGETDAWLEGIKNGQVGPTDTMEGFLAKRRGDVDVFGVDS